MKALLLKGVYVTSAGVLGGALSVWLGGGTWRNVATVTVGLLIVFLLMELGRGKEKQDATPTGEDDIRRPKG